MGEGDRAAAGAAAQWGGGRERRRPNSRRRRRGRRRRRSRRSAGQGARGDPPARRRHWGCPHPAGGGAGRGDKAAAQVGVAAPIAGRPGDHTVAGGGERPHGDRQGPGQHGGGGGPVVTSGEQASSSTRGDAARRSRRGDAQPEGRASPAYAGAGGDGGGGGAVRVYCCPGVARLQLAGWGVTRRVQWLGRGEDAARDPREGHWASVGRGGPWGWVQCGSMATQWHAPTGTRTE